MKRIITIFALLFLGYTTVRAQGSNTPTPQGYTNLLSKANFGAWYKPRTCLTVDARVAIVGTSKANKTHSWLIQFHNLYNKRINFTYYIFTPQEYQEFRNGQRITESFDGAILTSQTSMGMMGAQQYSSGDSKLCLLPDNISQIYVIILNVYFGDLGDPSAPRTYANDDCGKPTGYYQWNGDHQLLISDNANSAASKISNTGNAAQPAPDHTISPALNNGSSH